MYTVSTDDRPSSRTIIQFDTDTGETDFGHITAVSCPASLPTMDELKTELQKCADFVDIYRYLKTKELSADDSAARTVVLEANDYILQDDVLYHLFTPRTKRLDRAYAVVKQLCVPTKLRPDVAMALHD